MDKKIILKYYEEGTLLWPNDKSKKITSVNYFFFFLIKN